MYQLPDGLRLALRALAQEYGNEELAARTARLIDVYRRGESASVSVLGTRADAVAYAVYRMPATYAAVRSALAEVARAGGPPPVTHLDLGGGTGAAVWAVADTWDSLGAHRVLDTAAATLDLGRELARDARSAPLTRWETGGVDAARPADVVTVSYLLGELEPAARERLVGAVLVGAGIAVFVEPGTVAGHARILAARDAAIAAGMHVVAPCPHALACPLQDGTDWCHMAARVNRSAAHRRAKHATLGWEDEKFSYVAVSREPLGRPAPARVVRHPTVRKGLVELTLCTTPPGVGRSVVGRSRGEAYRAARKVGWGEPWAP